MSDVVLPFIDKITVSIANAWIQHFHKSSKMYKINKTSKMISRFVVVDKRKSLYK